MSVKRREPERSGMWVPTHELPRSPEHAFFEKPNEALHGFDHFVEELCELPCADVKGRPSIVLGVHSQPTHFGVPTATSSTRG